MAQQNYKNHIRLLPAYHGFTFLIILSCAIISIWNLVKQDELYAPDVLFVGISISLLCLFLFARMFALKAQDRAIRAEETLRYYILTGQRLPQNLTIQQVVALRFASDSEFVALVDEAAAANLAPKAIKQRIKTWRADHYRV